MYQQTAKQIYDSLEGKRQQYLDRARTCSRLTLPYIMPEDGFSSSTRIETPFASVSARGVNNLASKLLLALLPPNAPFFRLNVDTYSLKAEGADDSVISTIETGLQQVEEAVMDEISRETYRSGLHEALKHLIITGNALVYLPNDGGMRVFHLDRYVLDRDPMGNVLHIATKETIAKRALDKDLYDVVINQDTNVKADDTCNVYTAICRTDKGWHVFQDINGIRLPGEGMFPLDKNPYIPLRFSLVSGESYGRSYVEEYLGDIQSLESLTKSIVEGSAAAAKVLFLVNPNGTTRARTLAESPNGAITQGNANDVSVLQLNKFNDFKVAQETMNQIKERLGHAFLLTSGVVRDAERVTAEEIRMLSMELESSLGGLYSLLSSELQMPMVTRLMEVMGKKKALPKLPKDIINPVIVTGVEALGRGNDLQKLDMFLAGAGQVVGQQVVAQYVNVSEYFKRRATSLGIKTTGLVKTEEEIQGEIQAAQAQTLMERGTPNAVNALSQQIQQQQQIGSEEGQ